MRTPIYFYTKETETIASEDGFSKIKYTLIKINPTKNLTMDEAERKASIVAQERNTELTGSFFKNKIINNHYNVIECIDNPIIK